MNDPTATMEVVQAMHPGDPALDLDAWKDVPDPERDDAPARRAARKQEIAKAFDEYISTRSAEALAKLPVKKGAKLRRWFLRPIDAFELAAIKGLTPQNPRGGWHPGPQSLLLAFQVGVHRFTDEHGVDHRAETSPVADCEAVAKREWVRECQKLAGGQLIEELGLLVIERAFVAPHDLTPFALPPGGVPAL